MYEQHHAPDEPDYDSISYKIPYSPSAYRNRKREKQVSFSDLRIVKLIAGKGGDGKVSFLREAGRAKGPADGGDGGRGGSIYVQAIQGENSLHKLRNYYKAEEGKSGGSTQLAGRNGKNVLIQVPIGTTVKWIPNPAETRVESEQILGQGIGKALNKPTLLDRDMTVKIQAFTDYLSPEREQWIQLFRQAYPDGEGWIFKEKEEEYFNERDFFRRLNSKVKFYDLISRRRELDYDRLPLNGIDLDKPGEPVLLLRGGTGGMGNMHFLTRDIRNPRFAKKGRYGIEEHFLFELKLLADIGLVGLPNAGKSTLLRAVSAARPRVGHWEFTTLNPTIGTISLGIGKPSFSVADIPGIVRGASDNKGMGLDFLRHIERSGAVAFVLGLDKTDPREDLDTLIAEMGPERMKGKNVAIIATKADVEDSEQKFHDLQQHVHNITSKEKNPWTLIPCSGLNKENVEAVIQAMGHAAGKC